MLSLSSDPHNRFLFRINDSHATGAAPDVEPWFRSRLWIPKVGQCTGMGRGDPGLEGYNRDERERGQGFAGRGERKGLRKGRGEEPENKTRREEAVTDVVEELKKRYSSRTAGDCLWCLL